MIVKGGIVNLTITTSDGSAIPSGLVVLGILLDTNAQTLAYISAPLPVSGILSLQLDATMNVTYDYTLQVAVAEASAAGFILKSWQGTVLGKDLYAGIPEAITIPPLVSGGTIEIDMTDSTGAPVGPGLPINWNLSDLTIQQATASQSQSQYEVTYGTGTTDADGKLRIDLSEVPYIATDMLSFSCLFPGSAVYGTSGVTRIFQGSALQVAPIAVTLSLNPAGGAAAGTPYSVVFNLVNQDGSPYTVGLSYVSIIDAAGDYVSGQSATGTVTIAVPSYMQGVALTFGWAAATAAGTTAYGSNGPTLAVPTLSSAGSVTRKIVVQSNEGS